MDKEQVGLRAWHCDDCPWNPFGKICVERDGGDCGGMLPENEGRFLTTQQRDELIAESEARGALLALHNKTAVRLGELGGGQCKPGEEYAQEIFKDVAALTDKIRGEALEAARDYLREAAEHISPEGGGNLLIQAGDAIRALKP